MRKHYMAGLAVAALLASPGAFAQTTIGGPIEGPSTNANVQTGVNSAISTGQLGSNIGDVGSNNRIRGGSARATGGRGGAGGTVTNNLDFGGGPADGRSTMHYEGRVAIRQNPDLAALQAATANSCATPTGATGSGFGIGFGFLTTPESERCNARADASMLVALGRPRAALELLAQNRAVRAALAAAPEQAEQALPMPPPPAPPSYCAVGGRESTADRLMRERNC